MAGDEVLMMEARLRNFISGELKNITSEIKKVGKTAQDEFEKASKKTSTWNKIIGDAKNGLISFATRFGPAALAIGAATKALVEMANAVRFVQESTENFEHTLSRVRAIVQPTSQEFDNLKKRAEDLGISTVFSATQVGQAFVEMSKMGFTAQQTIDASAAVLDLAALAEINMAEAGNMLISTLNQFNLDASESERVVDVMAKSFTSSALDARKFSEAMRYSGTVASDVGLTIEETSALLATLAQRNVDASMAGTALTNMMVQLYQPGSKVSKLLNITADDTRSFSERLQALADTGVDVGEIFDILDKRAGRVANVLLKSIPTIKDYQELFENAGGSAKKMAEIMLDDVTGATIRLQSAQEGLGIAIGESFSDAKKARLEIYTELVKDLTEFIKRHEAEIRGLSIVFQKVLEFGIRFIRLEIQLIEKMLIIAKYVPVIGGVLRTGEILGGIIKDLGIKDIEKMGEDSERAIRKVAKAAEELTKRGGMPGDDKDIEKRYAVYKLHEETMEDSVNQIHKLQQKRNNDELQAYQEHEDLITKSVNRIHDLQQKRNEQELKSFQEHEDAILKLTKKSIDEREALRKHEQQLKEEASQRSIDASLRAAETLVSIASNEKNDLKPILMGLAIMRAASSTVKAVEDAWNSSGGNVVVGAALAAATVVENIALLAGQLSAISSAASGADFIARGPQLIRVGDNPTQQERVQITPMGSPNINGPQSQSTASPISFNITLYGGATTDDADRIVKGLMRAEREGKLSRFRNKVLA